jgi:hypothetical protein
MAPEHTIPLYRFQGTYAEVGAQIGDACAATIEHACDTDAWKLPAGRSIERQLALADA